ncbi:Testin [Trichinella nativa]|uniref:Testin n=1 Tax=Trichinella nativa TaxID=6335 RepID=A0A0V1KVF9_9BILA|nr:Testin [Trichinella nativa]
MTELEMLQQKLFRKFSIHNKFMSVSTHSQNVTMKTDVKSAIYAFENKKKCLLMNLVSALRVENVVKNVQCKCGKEDHDIVIENVDPGQFRIGRLFQKQADASNNNGRLLPQLNSSSAALENFEWTPPSSVSALLVNFCFIFILSLLVELLLELHYYQYTMKIWKAYFQSEKFLFTLPKEFRPIRGTEGAIRRRQALERQLPLHDLDINAASHPVDQCERVNMEKFLTTMKLCNVGQGAVKEVEREMQFHKFENCFSCNSVAKPGEVIVVADRFGPNTCHKCGKKIAADANRTEFAGIYWHANDECFSCSTCRKGLVRCRFLLAAGAVFCSTACKIASKEFFVHFRYLKWVRK